MFYLVSTAPFFLNFKSVMVIKEIKDPVTYGELVVGFQSIGSVLGSSLLPKCQKNVRRNLQGFQKTSF